MVSLAILNVLTVKIQILFSPSRSSVPTLTWKAQLASAWSTSCIVQHPTHPQTQHKVQYQQNVFWSLEDSRSVWEAVECKLRSVNFRRVSDPRRVFRQAFRVTGISDDRYGSNWDLWWLIQEYDGSDCDKFRSMSERQRELWVHLRVSPNQYGNHEQTLRDAWVLMDVHSENDRHYQWLFGYTEAIDFPQQRIWCMDYRISSLLNQTRCHLLQHCILCLTASRKQKKKARDSNINPGTPKS